MFIMSPLNLCVCLLSPNSAKLATPPPFFFRQEEATCTRRKGWKKIHELLSLASTVFQTYINQAFLFPKGQTYFMIFPLVCFFSVEAL